MQADFQREAALMAEFDNPNIVKLLGMRISPKEKASSEKIFSNIFFLCLSQSSMGCVSFLLSQFKIFTHFLTYSSPQLSGHSVPHRYPFNSIASNGLSHCCLCSDQKLLQASPHEENSLDTNSPSQNSVKLRSMYIICPLYFSLNQTIMISIIFFFIVMSPFHHRFINLISIS